MAFNIAKSYHFGLMAKSEIVFREVCPLNSPPGAQRQGKIDTL